MTLHTYESLEQGSDEWLQARCGILTASVMGQIISPKTLQPTDNETSRSLVREIVAERLTGQPDDIYPNGDMRRGTLSEPIARALYEEHYEKVTEVGFMAREADGLRIGFSPDGLTEAGLIEIKSPRAKHHMRTVLEDAVPSQHLAQIHAGMLVADRPHLDFVSYCPGHPLYVTRVRRDPSWDKALLSAALKFEKDAEQVLAAYNKASKERPPTEWIDVWMEEEIFV